MSSKKDLLRIAIRDEALTIGERKAAAAHYVAALLDEVPEPAEDDPAVVKLLHPPTPNGDEMMDRLLLVAWKHMNYLRGWREDGGTQAQVREHVLSRRRESLLEMLAEDTTHHDLVRAEAAAQLKAMPWKFQNLPQPVQPGR